jgi:hypothetical protein
MGEKEKENEDSETMTEDCKRNSKWKKARSKNLMKGKDTEINKQAK